MKKEYSFRSARRGSVLPSKGKTRITIWLDNDVLKWFRSAAEREGRGYQTVLNAALRAYTGKNREPLRQIVREVVKEELRSRRAM